MTTPILRHNPLLGADQPLGDPGEDALGYASFAKMLAQSALRGSPATGLVVGVYGEWGLGKTTLLNFIQYYAESDAGDDAPLVIRFNPWWSSGREDLLSRFFTEFEQAVLSSRSKRNKLRKAVGKLGQAAANVPNAWTTGIGKTAMWVAAHGQPADLKNLKDEIVRALQAEPLRVIVLIDDIDRLLPSEMVDIFRMVRSVGDLPNVHYVLAFDHSVVARALTDVTKTDGARYLEKIVQAPFNLPRPAATSLRDIFEGRLQRVLEGTDLALFDRHYWSEVLVHGVFPFLQTPRDVVRLINALAVIYPSVQNDVNPTDFVAIETLRVFSPDAYESIRANQQRFVGLLSAVAHMKADNKQFHERWLTDIKVNRVAVTALVRSLFPSVATALGSAHGRRSDGEYRKRRRICTEEVFEHYFRYVPGRGVSRREFMDCLNADSNGIGARLRSFVDERVDGRKSKLRQFLEMLHDELSSEAPPRDDLLRQICAVGDLLIAAMPTDFAFEAPDDIFLVLTLERVLAHLPEAERLPALRTALAVSGLSTVARVANILCAQHGRLGEESSASEERTLTSESDVDELEQIARGRLEEASRDGSLWKAPGLVRLLFDWKRIGGASQMREAVRSWALADISNMVGLIQGLGSPSSAGHVIFEMEGVEEIVDLDDASAAAATAVQAGKVDERQHVILTSFLDAYSATESTRREQKLRQQLLVGILGATLQSGWFPTIDHVNVRFEAERARIQELVARGALQVIGDGRYMVTSTGLGQLPEDPNARIELENRALLIRRLQEAYRTSARAPVDLAQLVDAASGQPSVEAIHRAATVLMCESDSSVFMTVEHLESRPKSIIPLPPIVDVPSKR